MTRFMFFVLTFGCIMHSLSAAHDAEFYSTVAQEAFDTGLYQMALDKCNEAIKKQPDNKGCIKIIADSTEQLNKQNVAEKKAEEKKRKEEAIEERKQEASSVASDICYTTGQIKEGKKYIATIQETGRRTGYIDKRAFYNANLGVVALEKQLDDQKRQYKNLTGKAFGSKCSN